MKRSLLSSAAILAGTANAILKSDDRAFLLSHPKSISVDGISHA